MNQLTNLPSADISAQHEQDAKDLTRILPASKKVYVTGSRPDIQVPAQSLSPLHLAVIGDIHVGIFSTKQRLERVS